MDREKKAIYNIVSNVIVQILVAVSGFIIPKFVLSVMGSSTNGMVNSIGQFLSYAGLIEMGIGNAAIAALYKPIAQKDVDGINIILSSSRKKYLLSGGIYTVIIVGLAFVYPLCIKGQLDYWFVFSMVIVIAGVNVIDYFMIGKYKVLLIADQKNYIINLIKSVATIVLTVISCFMLVSGNSLIAVKFIAILTHLCEAIFIRIYVKYKYSGVNYLTRSYVKLDQQKNAMIHQLCAVITYNTDLIILTLFFSGNSLKEVSVYSIYALAFSVINNGMSCFTIGMEAIFGNMAAKKEMKKLQTTFQIYKTGFAFITFLLYTCFFCLIIPFVRCYTRGVTDVNYIRLEVGILFGINGLLANLKDAHGAIIRAYGCYRQTQSFVIAESVLNIIVSLSLIRPFGITGVLIGTMLSHLITCIGIPWYVEKNILKNNFFKVLMYAIVNIVLMIILAFLEVNILYTVNKWQAWMLRAILVFVFNAFILGGANILMSRETFKLTIQYFNKIWNKKGV